MTPAMVEGSGGGKVMLQEEKEIIAFARRLAANEKRDRDQALKRLEAWMIKHKQLSERDLLKIWKGLFYCMWMSDKAQVQQELGRAISRLVHCFGPDLARAHLFVATFYRTVRREWTGLDQHRLDKFYSFMRSMLRECLAFAQQRAWSPEALAAVVLPLDAEVLVQPWPNGLRLHLCDLILPELAKVGGAGLTTAQALAVLQPFLVATAASADKVVAERARARVLLDLIEAKKKQRSKREAMDEDDEEEEKASMLDGVDLEALQATLFDLAAAPETREKYRAGLYDAHKGLQGLTGKKRADAAKAVLVPLPKPRATPVGRKGKKAGVQGEEEEDEEDDWMDEDEDGSEGEEGEDESEEEEEEDEEEAFAAPVKGSKKRKARGEIAPVKQQQQQQQQQQNGGKKQAVVVESKKTKKEEKKTATPMPTPVTSESKPAKGALEDKAEKKTKLSKKGEEEATTTTTKKKAMPPATQPSETKSSSSKRNAEKEKASTTTTAAATTTAAKKTGSLEQGTKRKSAEVEVPAGGKEEAATQKTAVAVKKTKVVVDGTATKQAAPSPEKKTKKQSTTAPASPAAPAAEPTFIPSKKFTGGKSGYAFKKGREGVGYYIDPVQQGGGAVASVGGAGNAGSNKKVRWGKVQVKLFNKHASPADGKGNTVSFMSGGAAGGGRGKQGGRGGRGGGGRGGGRQQNNNRRKAVSYF